MPHECDVSWKFSDTATPTRCYSKFLEAVTIGAKSNRSFPLLVGIDQQTLQDNVRRIRARIEPRRSVPAFDGSD